MFVNNMKLQLNLMFKKKSFQFIFTLLMLYAVVVNLDYVYKSLGKDISLIQSSSNIHILGGDGSLWTFFEQAFPFIVVFPYAFSYFSDQVNNTQFLLQIRGSRKYYYLAQSITTFIGGFIIIFIPFMINFALNLLVFANNGNYYNDVTRFDINYCWNVLGSNIMGEVYTRGIFLKYLFIYHPNIYGFIYILLASLLSGLLCLFSYSMSFFFKSFKIMIFLPVYVMVQILNSINSVFVHKWSGKFKFINLRLTDYISYSTMRVGKVYLLFLIFILLVFLVSISLIRVKIKSDER